MIFRGKEPARHLMDLSLVRSRNNAAEVSDGLCRRNPADLYTKTGVK